MLPSKNICQEEIKKKTMKNMFFYNFEKKSIILRVVLLLNIIKKKKNISLSITRCLYVCLEHVGLHVYVYVYACSLRVCAT